MGNDAAGAAPAALALNPTSPGALLLLLAGRERACTAAAAQALTLRPCCSTSSGALRTAMHSRLAPLSRCSRQARRTCGCVVGRTSAVVRRPTAPCCCSRWPAASSRSASSLGQAFRSHDRCRCRVRAPMFISFLQLIAHRSQVPLSLVPTTITAPQLSPPCPALARHDLD
jgi:hypothetical protein